MKKQKKSIHSVYFFLMLFLAGSGLSAQPYGSPDFDGDGKTDLALVREDNGGVTVNVRLSDRDGATESSWISRFGIFSATDRFFYGDFNGDGRSDLAQLGEKDGKMRSVIYLSGGTSFAPSVRASQSGPFLYSDRWFSADFDGDGKTDLARSYSENKVRRIDVYLSTGTSFAAPSTWMEQKGLSNADDIWLTGDFNGDGRTDFAIIEAGNSVKISVCQATGSAFEGFTWSKSSPGGKLTSMKWVAEDFDGDGCTDIASLWDDQGKVSIDVYRSMSGSFTNESWVSRTGDFAREHQWFTADFNGDKKADIGRLWNNNGLIQVESYQSDGSTFVPTNLLRSGAAYYDGTDVLVGNFDANPGSDLMLLSADGSRWYSQILSGGSEAELVSSHDSETYYASYNPSQPVCRDQFINQDEIVGAVPPGADLQAVLNSGNDLLLVKNGIYNVNRMLKYMASGQAIQTFNARFISDHAILRMQMDEGDFDTMLLCDRHDYTRLEQVTMDGNKFALCERYRAPKAPQGAMVLIAASKGYWIRRCVFHSTRTWSTCHLIESGDAEGHLVEDNYVLGAGIDPRGSGRNVGEIGKVKGVSDYVGWADGFSVGASNTVVRSNFIMDTTDVGVVLFCAPNCRVADNMIVNISRSTHGGINMVDYIRQIGENTTFGEACPMYEYRGIVIENNRLAAEGARMMVGIPFGAMTWGDNVPRVFNFEGGVIRNNSLEGGAFGFGYALDFILNVNFYGNSSTATHSGTGSGSKYNNYTTDPAVPFFYDPNHITVAPGGTLQPGFTANVLKLEDLLAHHSKPYTEDGFLYYPHTEPEAEATVNAAYWEMLGRRPTPQELQEGKDSFLNNVRQYGDAFRMELMKRPEFVSKFGPVLPENLHPFRVARWFEQFKVIDMNERMATGNYPDPKAAYDAAQAGLEYTLSGVDADILEISPVLPSAMKRGRSVSAAVTVRNTGLRAWQNRADDPVKYALGTVGNDARFGRTRFYIPDGVTVAPGESFTFRISLEAAPVPWAGEGKPLTTALPYDFRMVLESKGAFGESLTDHLGTTHRIEVENAPEPPPPPLYASKFIAQKISGDPQTNGILAGAEMTVEITIQNAGNQTAVAWMGQDDAENEFSLGSCAPQDNVNWGSNRIRLVQTQGVPSGETATFIGTLTAPSVPGKYNFQWQMVSPLYGVGWFGEMTPNLEITVLAPEKGPEKAAE